MGICGRLEGHCTGSSPSGAMTQPAGLAHFCLPGDPRISHCTAQGGGVRFRAGMAVELQPPSACIVEMLECGAAEWSEAVRHLFFASIAGVRVADLVSEVA